MTDETAPSEGEPESVATIAAPDDEAAAAEETIAEGGEEKKKLHQVVELADIGPCKKHIKVSIDEKDVKAAFDAKFSELVVDANVAGFRPGKAPRKIIERRYRKEVGQQLKGELLFQSLEQLADEHDVAPISPPQIDPTKIELPENAAFIYEFDVEVRPQFDLPNYKGIKLRRPLHTFTDDDVASEERRFLTPHGQIIPKPEGNAQIGDYIIVDMTARDGDRVLGTHKELQLLVERKLVLKDGLVENFGEKVRGANAGDTKVLDVVLSKNVSDATLAGKTAQLSLDVKEVKTLRLPELTREFLTNQFKIQSVEQLRETVRVVLQRRLEYVQRRSAREQVLAQITAASNWDLPEDLLKRQARQALSRRIMEMRGNGMADAEIRSNLRLLEQDALRSTAAALKEHFVLQKIAEVEKIDIDDDDITDEIDRIAYVNNDTPRRIRARLEKEDMMEALAAELIERKALDLVIDNAEYEDFQIEAEALVNAVTSLEEQAVPGEMVDPMAALPAEEPAAE